MNKCANDDVPHDPAVATTAEADVNRSGRENHLIRMRHRISRPV